MIVNDVIFYFPKAAPPKQITGDTFSICSGERRRGGYKSQGARKRESPKHCFHNTSDMIVTNLIKMLIRFGWLIKQEFFGLSCKDRDRFREMNRRAHFWCHSDVTFYFDQVGSSITCFNLTMITSTYNELLAGVSGKGLLTPGNGKGN